jgi:hypothetical protein
MICSRSPKEIADCRLPFADFYPLKSRGEPDLRVRNRKIANRQSEIGKVAR